MTAAGLRIPAGPLRSSAERLLRSRLLRALATPHDVDGYLQLAGRRPSPHDHEGELIAVRRQSAGSVTITLRPDHRWMGFSAGQFIRLTVEIAGVCETRCYSPACGEQADGGRQIELTVKAHPAGTVSRYLNEHVRPGILVGLSDADGDFVLPRERPERLLLISGGGGITPVMSMLRTLCAEGHAGSVTFLHYARNPDEVVYGSELAAIAARHRNVRIALAYTRTKIPGALAGHISRQHLRHIAPDHRRTHTYVCGPPGLIEWMRAGSVRNLLSGEISSARDEDIQMCVSAPVGDVELAL